MCIYTYIYICICISLSLSIYIYIRFVYDDGRDIFCILAIAMVGDQSFADMITQNTPACVIACKYAFACLQDMPPSNRQYT